MAGKIKHTSSWKIQEISDPIMLPDCYLLVLHNFQKTRESINPMQHIA